MLWWLKVLASALVIISFGSGSPINGDDDVLRNVEEVKYGSVDSPKGDRNKLVDPDTYRLPNTSIPLNYEITLKTDIHRGESAFAGQVRIHIRIENDTDEIVLHYRQLEIENVDQLYPNGTAWAQNLTHTKLEDFEFLVISLGENHPSGTEFILDISYNGILRSDGGGFYRGNYTNPDGIPVHYAATQFEINDARHSMPCFDEPGIRAPMKLTIMHDPSYSAIANMAVESDDIFGDYKFTIFKATPPMQTYLLAFLVSDFDHVNATDSRILQRIFAKPEAIANGEANFAASVVGEVLKTLEDALGVNYPNEKMDHAALNVFNFGAMENFGLITYIDNGLLLDQTLSLSSTRSQQDSIIGLISHEYAHQWFGDIVSPKWWTYTWLNEGFATLFTSYVPQLMNPSGKAMNNFVTRNLPTAFSNDMNGSWAMNHYTEDPEKLWDKFGAIGYQKSGCVLRMFMEVLTPPTFLKGLNKYLNESFMTAVTPDELHAGLQAAYIEDNPRGTLNIGELMYTWEDQPGYPLITVTIEGNNLRFSQRRYRISNREIYSVPLTIATKTNYDFETKTPKHWLRLESELVPQNVLSFNANDWIVVNIQQVGYYRVDYSKDLWHALISQLNEDPRVINSLNRAVLQDEIDMGWTTLGRVTANDVLSMLNYFDREDEPIAWSKAQNTLTTLHNRLFGTTVFDKFLELLVRITETHITVHGYSGFDGEDSEIASLRSSAKLWNCRGLDGKCLLNEYTIFSEYFLNGNQDVVFDYCIAMRLLAPADFAQILNGSLTNATYERRSSFLASLGCSLYPENLQNFLHAILDTTNSLTPSEKAGVISNTFSKSSIAMTTTLDFFEENYVAINQVNLPSLYNLLASIAAYVNGQPNLAKFESIVTKLRSIDAISSENEDSLSVITGSNAEWMSANWDAVLEFFDIEETTTTTTTTTMAPPTSSTSTATAPTTSPSTRVTDPETTPQETSPTTEPTTSPPTTTAAPTSPVPASTTPAGAGSIFASIALILICASISAVIY